MPLNIIIGDIFKMSVDAIVVPITLCNKISSKFSKKLYERAGYDNLMNERIKIGHLHCGKSAVTSGYNLKAKYIIHTAVSSWKNNLNDETEKISEQYGEYKLSAEERYSAYKSKYQSELKVSGLSVRDYNRKRVDFYLNKYITNKEAIANTIGWDKSSFSRFITGTTLKPKRYKVINLAIQMKLNEEERFEFIYCTGYSYPVSEKDRLIESKLSSGFTDFFKLNDELCCIDMKYDLTRPY